MKFKGDIIITDPCYIIKEESQGENDDWDICEYGSNMGALNLKTYISENTIYGDWSCDTFEIDDKPEEYLHNLIQLINKLNEEDEDLPEYEIIEDDIIALTESNKYIGSFCAGSEQVGVFLLDEVLKYNPDFDFHITKPWTTTLIKNFDGDVKYIVIDDCAYIIGTGNINFYTIQKRF